MSWNTPVVPVAATLITASWASTTVVDNLLALRATPANTCSVYRTANQVVTAANTGAIQFDNEAVDTAGMHDNSSSNTRITIPTGGSGRYDVYARMYGTNGGGDWYKVWLRKNGTSAIGDIRSAIALGGGGYTSLTVLGLSLSAGDYLELMVTSNGANNTMCDPANEYQYGRLEVRGPLPPA